MTDILIVDDNEGVRLVIGDYLAKLGFSTDEAEDIAEARELALRDRPRVVLLSYRVLAEALLLANELRARGIGVLFVTSDTAGHRAVMAAGYDVVAKPFRLPALGQAIIHVLDGLNLRRFS